MAEKPFTSDLLTGKKGVVFGVANKRSIAWAIARVLADHGAQMAFAYQGERVKEGVESLVRTLPGVFSVYECDVTQERQIENLFAETGKEFGALNFLVHCVAYARREDMEGRLVDTTREGFRIALDVSAYSLIRLVKAAEPLLEKESASVLALSYIGGEKVIPHYNVMGVAKAGLESAIRYLAHDLGRKNIRVNGISAGPVNTLAARGISGFNAMLENHRQRSALGRNIEPQEIADAALFLLSHLSSGITGEVLFVDGGYRSMGF